MSLGNKSRQIYLIIIIVVSIYYFLNGSKFSRTGISLFSNTKSHGSVNEEVYFRIERRLFKIHNSLSQRIDFIESRRPESVELQKWLKNVTGTNRRGIIPIKVEVEKLFKINPFKLSKFESIKNEIQTKLDRLQNQKCRLDNIVSTAIESECGYGCRIHIFTTALFVSYYWGRTLVYEKYHANGMENSHELFLPIAKDCRLNNKLTKKEMIREAIKPFRLTSQLWIDRKFSEHLNDHIKELSLYHHAPEAFIYGNFASFILRYNQSSSFYKQLKERETSYQLPRPYVGIHIRRTDKLSEAKYHETYEYMREVNEFYEIYFAKNSIEPSKQKRVVYAATDEPSVLDELVRDYKNFTFVFNDTVSWIAMSTHQREKSSGFEGFLQDVHFLSNADYLVCTFTSNVCRLSYEIMLSKHPDEYPLAKSVDIPYRYF